MVVAVGPQASGTVANDLAKALASKQVHSTAPLQQAQQNALQKLSVLLIAVWAQITGTAPQSQDVDAVFRFSNDPPREYSARVPAAARAVPIKTHLLESLCPASQSGLCGPCAACKKLCGIPES
jgi:hypothetical protein